MTATRQRSPIKWDDRKPVEAGLYSGKIWGQSFTVSIHLDKEHSQRTTWSMNYDILGEGYLSSGRSGGMYRALRNLATDLAVVCRSHGIES